MGEAIAQDLAARCGIVFDEKTTQVDLLFKLNREIRLDANIAELFHTLRIEGNRATHQFKTRHKEALDGLRIARPLAVWFHQAFGKQGTAFHSGPFIPPEDPSQQLRGLGTQIEQLKAKLSDANEKAETDLQLIELIAQEKAQYVTLAEQMDAEARLYEQMALEQEKILNQERQNFEARLKALQAELENQQQRSQQASVNIQKATKQFSLNEELTRILIDQQLMAAGWDADTELLTYHKGARPEKGKNKAIAEWPTQANQSADYVLFAGLTPIAVVEAKRENVNVAGKIPQAERYARDFKPTVSMLPAWQLEGRTIAWPDSEDGHYQIPFVYSCNGRPFVKQLAEQSGTWFRDTRDVSNLAKPLPDFYSPEGLLDRLKRNKTLAEARLREEGFVYLKLRDYQEKAVQAVETALQYQHTQCLLAMATGTGKTRTIIGLIYRFLKAERFKRILFLVDCTALGQQALGVFNDAPLEQNQTLSKIYNIAELGDMAVAAETRVQVVIVQAMVKRIFQSDAPPSIDAYDFFKVSGGLLILCASLLQIILPIQPFLHIPLASLIV